MERGNMEKPQIRTGKFYTAGSIQHWKIAVSSPMERIKKTTEGWNTRSTVAFMASTSKPTREQKLNRRVQPTIYFCGGIKKLFCSQILKNSRKKVTVGGVRNPPVLLWTGKLVPTTTMWEKSGEGEEEVRSFFTDFLANRLGGVLPKTWVGCFSDGLVFICRCRWTGGFRAGAVMRQRSSRSNKIWNMKILGNGKKSKKYLELKFGGGGAKSICRQCMLKGEKKEFAKKLAEKVFRAGGEVEGSAFTASSSVSLLENNFSNSINLRKVQFNIFFTPSNPSNISTLVVQANFWHFLLWHFWNCWMLIPSAFVTLSILMVIMARFWYFYYCGTQSICFVLLIFLPQFAFLT